MNPIAQRAGDCQLIGVVEEQCEPPTPAANASRGAIPAHTTESTSRDGDWGVADNDGEEAHLPFLVAIEQTVYPATTTEVQVGGAVFVLITTHPSFAFV